MKSFILTLCAASIIGMICRSLVEKPSHRRIINMITVLAAVLAAIGSFPKLDEAGGGGFDTIEERSEKVDRTITGRYLRETEKTAAQEIERLAAEEGYSLRIISIYCSVNEYDTIVVDKAEAVTDAPEQAEDIKSYLKELLPDTEIVLQVQQEVAADG